MWASRSLFSPWSTHLTCECIQDAISASRPCPVTRTGSLNGKASIVRSIGTQGCQCMVKMYNVGEECEIPNEKSGGLDFNAWGSLWTAFHSVRQGSQASVSKAGGWNQRHILPETVVFAALKWRGASSFKLWTSTSIYCSQKAVKIWSDLNDGNIRN